MAQVKHVIKGIDTTRTDGVKGQGQPKPKPETAQQVTVTKPAPPPPKKENKQCDVKLFE